ncbi:MAG: hypothetical protein HY744_19935, partial [Deltaproteobacteria bacterium]|nr:hypothetical protein [Deltaproteobacteria bacterium]
MDQTLDRFAPLAARPALRLRGARGAACAATLALATGAALLACSAEPVTVAPGGGGGQAAGCPAQLIACGERCVDPLVDPAHCGGCDKACAVGEVCTAGQCAVECGPGNVKCAGQCVNTDNDPAHCGGC